MENTRFPGPLMFICLPAMITRVIRGPLGADASNYKCLGQLSAPNGRRKRTSFSETDIHHEIYEIFPF
jgi:hypothetical protein